jgi:hypothetical protein
MPWLRPLLFGWAIGAALIGGTVYTVVSPGRDSAIILPATVLLGAITYIVYLLLFDRRRRG